MKRGDKKPGGDNNVTLRLLAEEIVDDLAREKISVKDLFRAIRAKKKQKEKELKAKEKQEKKQKKRDEKRANALETRTKKFVDKMISLADKRGFLNEGFAKLFNGELRKKGLNISTVGVVVGGSTLGKRDSEEKGDDKDPELSPDEGEPEPEKFPGCFGGDDEDPDENADFLLLQEEPRERSLKDPLDNFIYDYSKKYPLLSRKEEEDLARRIALGDIQAREILIGSNIRFVASIARKYFYRNMPMEDLMGYGIIGLIDAVDRFNPFEGRGTGCKFSTYAFWWIRQSIRKNLADFEHHGIHVPIHKDEKYVAILKVERSLVGLKEDHDDEAIGEYLNIAPDKIESIRSVVGATRSLCSLDEPIEDGGNKSFYELVGCDSHSPEKLVGENELRLKIRDALKKSLRIREWAIIDRHFGLTTREEKTLEEIGDEFGLTRERIRQIESKAMGKVVEIFKKLRL